MLEVCSKCGDTLISFDEYEYLFHDFVKSNYLGWLIICPSCLKNKKSLDSNKKKTSCK